jgi:PAS domain S-box-containing protein
MTSDVDILIVDDRPENLVAMEAMLSAGNYRLVTASSGPDALRKILEHDFAVMLIDVVMPEMDGFEVVEIIKQRERSRHTPIIFLSAANKAMDFVYRGYSVGAVDYLTKPIEPDVLRAKVAIFAEMFRKDQRIREQAEALRAAERREQELELVALRVASEQRYRNLADAIPQIVWTAGADGEITYFNRRWQDYTGQSPEQSRGGGWMAALHAGDVARAASSWQDGLQRREVFELECRLTGHRGEARWHLCRAVPEVSDGQIVAWLGTFTDCDDLKRACDTAELAVSMRDEFLSIASHELRTPLTTLQLRLNSLHGEIDGSRKLDACLRQSARLVSLVESLFDFSRITTGKLVLKRERFDLAQAARDAVDRLSAVAAVAGVNVRVEGEDNVCGTWDRMRIEQVIENLVNNAIKYAANSPIVVAVHASDDTAKIAVTDHGPGIANADLTRIFGPFERASSNVSYSGMGLGLYIAREYTTAHRGTIAVTSTPGESTTFTVELPRS